jgi:hypothetical protein
MSAQNPSGHSQVDSPAADGKHEAIQPLPQDRAAAVKELVVSLDKQDTNPDRAFGGLFHLTLQAISKLRAPEAVLPLTSMVGFQLNPKTLPAGMFGAPPAFYPVSTSLG